MKETKPQTYRISDEVDAELRRRAALAGGIDKALREVLFLQGYSQTPPSEQRRETQARQSRPLRDKGDTKR